MIRAVVFDLDDTLISEKKYIESGYQYISKILSDRYDKDAQELNQLLFKLFNESPQNVFNRILDKMGISYTKNDILEMVEEYRGHLPDIRFFDDVLPCLKELKKKNIKIGVITDGYANAQRQKLKVIKATNFFDEIIVTDELGREFWKPHPKSFELMKEKLNVEFNEMIYVGDNPEKDFYISNIYPIKTTRIYRDGVHSDKSYLGNIKENHMIHRLCELNLIIDKK
ncbi:HAD-IA family hydrolase [Peribacillus simplex]|uniref:HAD-IA family hydrolase n=2 Tax=Peribacillus TaxID=2675229 RepID=A0AA90SZN9_9BACI|nr:MULTISPECIES: HAD-IA family hydrolase [Peribacillus]MDP1417449.1 HAD-IA family hydrolase [Peribacillus simplex]MDP1450104.1 HAD-IA family hydrolase [Peribacillus frigoritolerans]